MGISKESADKLSQTLMAAAISGGAYAAGLGPVAAVPALLAGASLSVILGYERAQRAEQVLKRMADHVARESDTWIRREIEPGARGQRARALEAFDRVMPNIVPTPKELVEHKLDRESSIAFLLQRAAKEEKCFEDSRGNEIAREIFRDIVGYTFDIVRNDREVRTHVFEALLGAVDRIERTQAQHGEVLSIILKAVTVEKSVPLAMLQEILIRMGESGIVLDPVQIEQKLRAKADEYLALKQRLDRLSNDDPRVRELRRGAAEDVSKGEFEAADEKLCGAELVDLDAVEEIEAVAKQRRISAAETRAERGATAMLRLDYRAAASHYAAATATLPPEEIDGQWRYKLQQAAALYGHGDEFGDNAALAEAIGIYQEALRMILRERAPLPWATMQNNLGNVLASLGERERSTARLGEAVTAYREALTEWPRERVPLLWATAQNNLGSALARLGEREVGKARLEQAVSAFREVLKEWTRGRVPLQWARTQHNLGTSLTRLGERESGAARLEEAVAAYREALKESTRERVPLQWAGTQNNLGDALQTLGEREEGTDRLEQAVSAFREALKEWTRDRMPLQWAGTQNNLGNVLRSLSERESGAARLEEAVAACHEALKERTRERVPLDWAATQNNLGNALKLLGERKSETARLEEATSAFRESLKERTRERVPLEWARTQNNLGNALQSLGERESDVARFEEAVAAYREALSVFESSSDTYMRDIARRNLACTEALLAARRTAKG